MKKVLYKQPKKVVESSYTQTKSALEYLYQESLRTQSPELAAILKQSIQHCESLIEGDVVRLGDAADAIYCMKFIRAFMGLDMRSKQNLLQMLLIEDQH